MPTTKDVQRRMKSDPVFREQQQAQDKQWKADAKSRYEQEQLAQQKAERKQVKRAPLESQLHINPQTGQPFGEKQVFSGADLGVGLGMHPLQGGEYSARSAPAKLAPEQEAQFQQWAQKGNHPVTSDYDMRQYYLDNPGTGARQGQAHYPDTYKLPSHETFSNESIYAAPREPRHWKGDQYYKGEQFIKNEGKPMSTKDIMGREKVGALPSKAGGPTGGGRDPLRHGTPFDEELYTKQKGHKLFNQRGANTTGGTPFDDELYDRGPQRFTKEVPTTDAGLGRRREINPIEAGQQQAKLKAYARSNPKIMQYLLSLA